MKNKGVTANYRDLQSQAAETKLPVSDLSVYLLTQHPVWEAAPAAEEAWQTQDSGQHPWLRASQEDGLWSLKLKIMLQPAVVH